MSLDERINQRTSQRIKAIKKPVSNVDRSVGTSKARREAAVNARRGRTRNTKPTKMQIETEVKKQGNKTAIKKANQQNATKKKSGGDLKGKQKVDARKKQREVQAAGKKAAKAEGTTLKPTKKQLKAGRDAMIGLGYTFARGQVLDVLVRPPKVAAAATKTQTKKPQQQPSKKTGKPETKKTTRRRGKMS